MARSKIMTPFGVRAEIQRRTGATQPTIRKALNGEYGTPPWQVLYMRIRQEAMALGGVEVENN
ncbi:MAG: hypothetical protein ACI4TV_00450 [Paludibacteraceae bacterium]